MSTGSVLSYILIFTLLGITSSQILKIGKCPKFQLQKNFQPKEYFTGLWYEQKRFWAIFETGSKCVNAEYTLLDDNTVQVNNSGVNGRSGERYSQIGEAYCEADRPAACHVRFYPGTPYGDYNLISADPKKYGLVFTCREILGGLANTQFAWILTRDKVVNEADMQNYYQIFKQNGIDTRRLLETGQKCTNN